MTRTVSPQEPQIVFRPDGEGSTRAELFVEGRAVSRLWVYRFTLCIGEARVAMDGIGGVGTEKEYRRRGYSRRVLEATVERMRSGDAALSMLYGIRDFYPKFGYATAGPEHVVALTHLSSEAAVPASWQVRPIEPRDLTAVRRLYEQATARAVGAAVRAENGWVWTRLAETARGKHDDACRVVETPSGEVVAYAWQGKGFWAADMAQGDFPEALVLAEVIARDPAAADAVLAACRLWATEVSRGRQQPLKEVLLSLPPEGHVAAAAMRQDARFIQEFTACGASMARTLDVARLLDQLRPELQARLEQCRLPFTGSLRFETEIGAATLSATPEGLVVASSSGGANASPDTPPTSERRVTLPQADLARLALGAFPPEDLLARLKSPPDAATAELLAALFPRRHPHMYLPDRY